MIFKQIQSFKFKPCSHGKIEELYISNANELTEKLMSSNAIPGILITLDQAKGKVLDHQNIIFLKK